ncbi:alpha/beta hydrolase [Nocardioides pacificus]
MSMRRSRPRWPVAKWIVLLVVGMLLQAAGLGLGPRHYAEDDLSPVAVAGLALTGVGLAVIVWAAWRILAGMRRRWWGAVIAPVLVFSYLTAWTLGQAVAASFPPRPALGEATPADVGLAYSDVSFPSSDGVELAGWYVPSRNGAAVALLHGAGSTRSAVLDHAVVLAEHGYGVLLFDARGHGESAGEAMDFGWYGESDARGAVDFLARRPDVSPDRLGLVGMSMGGEEAIGAAGGDERVAAVVAEGATNRVAADKGYLSDYGVRGEVQQGIDGVTYWLTDLLSDAPRPLSLRRSTAIASARSDPTTFLLIAAGDETDEGLAADYLQQAGHGLVQTWTVENCGHVQGLSTAPALWEERVIDFLEESLDGARS